MGRKVVATCSMQIEWMDNGRGGAVLETEGAHELALAHVLDAIFADAYHAGLETLVWYGGRAWLPELELRAELTPIKPSGLRGVIAVDSVASVVNGERLYWIRRRGSVRALAPGAWRRVSIAGWYTPKVRWWGVAIRASRLIGRADWVDRTMAGMRADFGQDGDRRAEYQLAIYQRRDGKTASHG